MRNAFATIAIATLLSACSNAANGPATAAPASAAAVSASDIYYGAHLPPGPELTALKTNCEICHSGDMYATQRLSKAMWKAEVTKMMGFGSPLPASEKQAVIVYLATYLGPSVPRATSIPVATAPPISYSSPPQ